MTEPLCQSCINREIEWRLKDNHHYAQVLVCVYDMANFPNMHKCIRYESQEVHHEAE